MAFSYFIQPTLPPDTGEKPSLGASRIRNLKNALVERLNSWIYGFDSAGTESDLGLKSAPFVTGSAPTEVADKVLVYAKDVSSKAELHAIDEDGDEVQLTSGGSIANVGAYATKDFSTEYLADRNLFLPSDYQTTITIATDINFTSVVYTGSSSMVVKKGHYYKALKSGGTTYPVIGV